MTGIVTRSDLLPDNVGDQFDTLGQFGLDGLSVGAVTQTNGTISESIQMTANGLPPTVNAARKSTRRSSSGVLNA